jgi:glycine/D-amino acid oxidase-like deaminating enzyme/nitrite reductase/ring-hydroxylating ferredoxin subunit
MEVTMTRTPEETTPVWQAPGFAAQDPDDTGWSRGFLPETQVCVIGAGIAGLTTAYLLQRNGHRVQVLDAAAGLCAGETGRTTAHLSAVLDDSFVRLERLFDTAGARLAAASHAAAIDCIEAIAGAEGIDCDFERLDGILVAEAYDPTDFAKESEAMRRAGFSSMTELHSIRDGQFLIDGPALRIPRQATFNIGKYMRGLARAFIRRGGHLAFGARVLEVKGGRDAHVKLDSGARLRAAHIVVATNTPFNDRVKLHTKQAAYRSYVVGFEVPRNGFPAVLLWDMADPYHYVRPVRGETHDVVIVGGEDHKTGQADDPEMRYQRLESWARARFAGLGAMRYRWSGQLMEPVDALGFIGRNPLDDDNVYVVTGDSGDGMTHGTIAGMLIGDLVAGRANPWEKLYDPTRKSVKAAATYVEENANFVGHMVRDWVRGGEVHDRADIPPGEGAIIRDGLSTHAVYRDPQGDLHELSAVCTHLGCLVQWNSGEKSWDCPCHGSRFAVDGAVLHGPANAPLHAVETETTPPPDSPRPQPRA